MRNLTITVEESVLRWAKVWAARHDTSVSRLVGELIRKRMEEEKGYSAAMKRYLARRPVELKTSGGYPSRDDLHAR